MPHHCEGLKGDMVVTSSGFFACSESTSTKIVPATVASSRKERNDTFGPILVSIYHGNIYISQKIFMVDEFCGEGMHR